MKIRGKDRKIDIQKIYIEKDSSGGTTIDIIINNQLISIYSRTVYIDSILQEIENYMKVLGDNNYVRI